MLLLDRVWASGTGILSDGVGILDLANSSYLATSVQSPSPTRLFFIKC